MQAPFNISLTAPASQAVLSNTRLVSRMPVSAGLTRHTFEQTPPMSTYLVAFVVGNLTNVSTLVPGRTPFDEPRTVSIWATPHRWDALSRNKLANKHSNGTLCTHTCAPARQACNLQSCTDLQHSVCCVFCVCLPMLGGGKAMTQPLAVQR